MWKKRVKNMEIKFQYAGPESWAAQAVLAPCCEGEDPAKKYPELDKACPWLAIAPALTDFAGKKGEIAVLHGHPDLKLPRVIAIGLGERAKAGPDSLRDGLALAARRCRELGLKSALLPVSCLRDLEGGKLRLLGESACGFCLGLYRFTELKTKKDDLKPDPEFLIIAMDKEDEAAQKAALAGANAGRATARGRNLDNLPGNMLYPESLALRANEIAQAQGIKCSIFNAEGLAELGAGCILAVGSGSTHEPRLIVLEYGEDTQAKPLVLIGKGITFDSGGLCLKPPANMGQMKCDMSGAAAVLSVIEACAAEKAPGHIVAILACAENMPDGRAYRPGDVLQCLNGETIEVINTDAEGRLVLADALAYAQKFYQPCAIIDIATLTGACAVALGNELAGLFASDDDLGQKIMAIGAACGENYWRLPLWPGYRESLKSEIADIKHTGSREGGAITAALFLKNFVSDDIPWVHLDIAGVDWTGKTKPTCTEGASGFGIRTLLELCRGGLK